VLSLSKKLRSRRAAQVALIATLLIFAVEAVPQNTNSSEAAPEDLIKTDFIYNVAKLVEWPIAAFAQPGHHIVIGVLGQDSFADILGREFEGKRIDSRPFLVKRLRNKEFRDCGCHILFIASAQNARVDEIIQALKHTSVLTIAETRGFAKRGGIINFTLEDATVHFEVNADAARQAGLNISSRLLSLANIVQTGTSSR